MKIEIDDSDLYKFTILVLKNKIKEIEVQIQDSMDFKNNNYRGMHYQPRYSKNHDIESELLKNNLIQLHATLELIK